MQAPELTTRGYQPADAPTLCELTHRIEAHAGGHPGVTPEELRSSLDTMVRDATSDTRLVFAPDGSMVAAGVVSTPPAGGSQVNLIGGVDPGWRGHGLGRELLGWQLARSAAIRRAQAPEATWEVHVDSMVGDESALRLFRRFGMTPVRFWFDMVAPTAAAPSRPLPEPLRVVTYSPEYERILHATHMEVFADHWGYQTRELAEWVAVSVRQHNFRPELSLLAFDRDTLAGYVLSYDDADPERLYIGQVGTRRPWRRRGVAGALLARVLRAAGEAGLAKAGLGVDAASPTGAVGAYERAGFAVESRSVTYSAALPVLRTGAG